MLKFVVFIYKIIAIKTGKHFYNAKIIQLIPQYNIRPQCEFKLEQKTM